MQLETKAERYSVAVIRDTVPSGELTMYSHVITTDTIKFAEDLFLKRMKLLELVDYWGQTGAGLTLVKDATVAYA